MAKPRLKLHVISHIQWDREGLSTFQESRLGLVWLLDRIMTVFAIRPQFGSLILGGQNILIEDYLEVRPQYRAMLSDLAQSGRLCIGPWYVLPNEFLVSPEALIRNLLLGGQTAASISARFDLGYMPGMAAHIGQLPQILRSFGLGNLAITYNSQADVPLEQWWLAPDGSGLLLVNLYEEPGNPLAQPADAQTFLAALTRIKNRLKGRTQAHSLAVLYESNGHEPPEQIVDLIDSIQGQMRGAQVVHGDLAGYLARIAESATDLPSLAGEILSPQMPAGCLSTHIWVKQYNHDVQTVLEHWAEPFGAWASLLGPHGVTEPNGDWLHKPDDLIDRAWQLLLPNHAYPSISGQVVDQVHREMQVRFDQAAQIGAAITGQSLHALADQVDTRSLPGEEHQAVAVVFNGAGHPHTDIITLDVPPSLEDGPFRVLDAAGASLPAENMGPSQEMEGGVRIAQPRRVSFAAHDVPAYGYRAYILEPGAEDTPEVQFDDGTIIENRHLSVSVDRSDGTLTLFDKNTGRTFAGLNRTVDGGDCGDAAAYRLPPKDTLIDIATNMPLQVERRVSSVQQELSYLQIFRLPQQLTSRRDARLPLAAQFVPISIATTLRVASDVPRLDIEVEVSNNALDHRLRAHFPTGIDTPEALFDGHFEVVRRTVPGDYPQRAFVTIMGADTGLTIANRGLPEVAVLDGREGAEVALTLLRSIGWLRLEDIDGAQAEGSGPIQTPDAQCRGAYRFSYSLIPHGQDPLPAWQQAWAYQTPLRGLLTAMHPGALPVDHSLVTVDNPAFVLSTVKTAKVGDGLIVRGYSISSGIEQVTLRLGVRAAHAQLVRIDETPTEQTLKPDSRGRYKFKVRPAQIVTLHFSTASGSDA